LSKVKVIDMTGPQQRVLSGYHAIAGQQRPADEWELRKDKKFVNFALPELQHNLNLLMDMCEQVHTRCRAENQTLCSMKNAVFWDVVPTGLLNPRA
jgi:tuftelin-interacting protein 11